MSIKDVASNYLNHNMQSVRGDWGRPATRFKISAFCFDPVTGQ